MFRTKHNKLVKRETKPDKANQIQATQLDIIEKTDKQKNKLNGVQSKYYQIELSKKEKHNS